MKLYPVLLISLLSFQISWSQEGCTDSMACNYESTATIDDGTCFFQPCNIDSSYPIDLVVSNMGYCIQFSQQNSVELPGGFWYSFTSLTGVGQVVVNSASNDVILFIYDSNYMFLDAIDAEFAVGTESYLYDNFGIGETYYLNIQGYPTLNPSTTFVCIEEVLGCADSLACNYDSEAIGDNGTCCYTQCGCTDAYACNYDSLAECNDGTCLYPGCLDSSACNYDPNAGCDDACQYILIEGIVFNDTNQDGDYDGAFWNEPGLFNWQVEIVELGLSTYTNADGYYQFFNIPSGSYTVLIENVSEGWLSTSSLEVLVNASCNPEMIDFGFAAEGTSPFWLNGPCCIWLMDIHCENGFNPGLWINNTGSIPLNGTVTVSFDPILEAVPLEGNAVEPSDISPGIVTWDLVDSPIGGESLLFQCHINGPGFELMGEQFDITINVSLEDEGVEYYNNTWILEPIVVCSYDPNDKYAAEEGYTEEHFILPDNSIEYRIRFQNTGNFAAEDITITDMLDIERLDMETFQPMFGSHSYMTCVQPDGQIDFVFEDIFLPDSASNEPGSQGYVVYRITPMEGIEPGEVINNTANIYFDSNPAIVTNTTWHTIMDCEPVPEFTMSSEQLCLGEMLSLETTSDYAEEVTWFVDEVEIGDGNSIDYIAPETGTYQIDVEVSNPLCNETSIQNVTVNPLPAATFTEDGVILTASAGTSFQWYLNGNSIDGATNQIWEAIENGDYSVEVTNEFNCSDISDEITVIVIEVEEMDSADISIYPNPIRETATLFLGESGSSYDVQIISASGQLVRSYQNISANKITLERRTIASGTYVMKLINRHNFSSKELKIVFE